MVRTKESGKLKQLAIKGAKGKSTINSSNERQWWSRISELQEVKKNRKM
jgi:hypothetical protein